MMATMLPTPAPADLASLYDEEYDGLVRLAALLVDDRSSAEEVVQDAFVGLAKRPGGISGVVDPGAFLRRSVVNGSRSHLRRRGTRRRHLASMRGVGTSPSAESEVVLADEHRAVMEAVRTLSQRQREVLTLRFHVDLSEAEIAATLGISPGSVKTHASRGLDRLRTLLEEDHR